MNEDDIAEIALKLMMGVGGPWVAALSPTMAVTLATNASFNNQIHQAQQAPPQATSVSSKPTPLKFIYKKRRNRIVHKRFPFQLEVRFADKEKRDEIDEYLRTSLGPQGQDWLRPQFSTYFFTKRDFSAQIAFRFRGTQ